jgi:hypothetical protein
MAIPEPTIAPTTAPRIGLLSAHHPAATPSAPKIVRVSTVYHASDALPALGTIVFNVPSPSHPPPRHAISARHDDRRIKNSFRMPKSGAGGLGRDVATSRWQLWYQ